MIMKIYTKQNFPQSGMYMNIISLYIYINK